MMVSTQNHKALMKKWKMLSVIVVTFIVFMFLFLNEKRNLGLIPNLNLFKIDKNETDPLSTLPLNASKIPWEILNETHTWTYECKKHVLRNQTWGKLYSKYADKFEVKTILNQWDIFPVKISPTLAWFNETKSFQETDLKNMPDKFVIKAAHFSGGIALFENGTYTLKKRSGEKRPQNTI